MLDFNDDKVGALRSNLLAGRYGEAQTLIQSSMQLIPRDPIQYLELIQTAAVLSKSFGRFETLFLSPIEEGPNERNSYIPWTTYLIGQRLTPERLAEALEALKSEDCKQLFLEALGGQFIVYGDYSQAERCARRLMRDFPASCVGPLIMAKVVGERELDFDLAKEYLRSCLKRRCFEYAPYLEYLFLLLKLGEWDEAKSFFHSFYPSFSVHFEQSGATPKAWRGEPLKGKTILVDSKLAWGLGDSIQFVRFARELKDRGARVGIRADAIVRSLIETASGLDFIESGDNSTGVYDYVVDSLLLWLLLDLEAESLGAPVPYLKAASSRVTHWAGRLCNSGVLNIGLAWRSSQVSTPNVYTGRSMNAEELRPLMEISNVCWHSLQVPPAGHKLALLFGPGAASDMTGDLQDFADTAALVTALDAIVCVDTAVAHVAGALNKPACLMVPYSSDWRWSAVPDRSIWYPSVTVVRQAEPGEWSGVVRQVVPYIRKLAG